MYTTFKEVLPNKNRFSLRAISRFLNADNSTIRYYHSEIAPVVKDYRDECRRQSNGNISNQGGLSPYQAWVLCKIIGLSRLMAEDLKGTAYKKIVKNTVIEKVELLSKVSYLQEQEK